jgi:hypothetical protein
MDLADVLQEVKRPDAAPGVQRKWQPDGDDGDLQPNLSGLYRSTGREKRRDLPHVEPATAARVHDPVRPATATSTT